MGSQWFWSYSYDGSSSDTLVVTIPAIIKWVLKRWIHYCWFCIWFCILYDYWPSCSSCYWYNSRSIGHWWDEGNNALEANEWPLTETRSRMLSRVHGGMVDSVDSKSISCRFDSYWGSHSLQDGRLASRLDSESRRGWFDPNSCIQLRSLLVAYSLPCGVTGNISLFESEVSRFES